MPPLPGLNGNALLTGRLHAWLLCRGTGWAGMDVGRPFTQLEL